MTSFDLTAAERERVEAIDHLVARGAPAVGELIARLTEPSWTVRRAVVAGLAALGDDAAAPLCAWLRTERTDEHAIAAAVDALAASIGTAVTPACIALLDDAVAAVVADAAQVLGRRGAVAAIPRLAGALAHDDDNVAVAAIEALGAIGGSGAVDALLVVLAQRNFFRAFPALQVLVRTGDPRVIAPIAALLADDSYRVDAVRALGRTGFAQAIAPLAALLPDAPTALVRIVALALADLLGRADGALVHVVATMQDQLGGSAVRFVGAMVGAGAPERAAIATVLGRIGDVAVVAELVALLDDADADVRRASIAALQQLGAAHVEAVVAVLAAAHPAARLALLPGVQSRRAAGEVRALLADDDPEVRARACEALARLGDTAAVPQLFAALADANPRVAHAATAAIQALGTPETGTRTLEALRRGAPIVRRHALRIIAAMGFDHAFDAVVRSVDDPDAVIAELAVAALGALGDPRVGSMLAELGRDPREGVRAAAMRTIAQRGESTAPQELARGLTDDAPWVRYYAVQGFGRLGEVGAIALVIERLADPAPFVRIAAIEALGHLDAPASWQALCSVVRSAETDEHRAALGSMALGRDARALPFLLDGARSADLATQLISLGGLAQRAEPAALAALAAAVTDGAGEVRDGALSLLGARDDAGAANALVDLALASPLDHPVQRTLSQPGAARLAAIVARLPTVDDSGAARLIGALARLGDVRALASALALASAPVRRAAARSLAFLGDVAALGALAVDDPDLEVRRISASVV